MGWKNYQNCISHSPSNNFFFSNPPSKLRPCIHFINLIFFAPTKLFQAFKARQKFQIKSRCHFKIHSSGGIVIRPFVHFIHPSLAFVWLNFQIICMMEFGPGNVFANVFFTDLNIKKPIESIGSKSIGMNGGWIILLFILEMGLQRSIISGNTCTWSLQSRLKFQTPEKKHLKKVWYTLSDSQIGVMGETFRAYIESKFQKYPNNIYRPYFKV